MAGDRKEVIAFRGTIAAGASGTLSERVKADGTVESVRARFYPGQQLALRVRPYVEHHGRKQEDLVTYVGSVGYLAGDDDSFDFPVVVDVSYDDEIKLDYNNTDGTFDYDLVVDIVVDYYGGKVRLT